MDGVSLEADEGTEGLEHLAEGPGRPLHRQNSDMLTIRMESSGR